WRNPVWWQFLSHKILRLVIPWALIGMLISAAILGGRLYRVAFWTQIALYLLASVGTLKPIAARSPEGSAAASFLVLNVAAWLAFWVWLLGRHVQSWSKVAYDDPSYRLEQAEAEPPPNLHSKS
ncbi:MAG: hypothetical protein ACLQU5_14720, partial [Isosphaeraceae bacterium]